MPLKRTKATERELAGWISEQINRLLDSGGFPFEECTIETSVYGKFPDLVLWNNRIAKDAFAIIELKIPGKIEDLKRLPKLATDFNIKFAITWDFLQGNLYYINNNKLENRKTYPTYLFSEIDDWVYEIQRNKIKKYLFGFIDDLKEMSEKGHLHEFSPDKFFFINLLKNHTEKIQEYFKIHFIEKLQDKKFKLLIDKYLIEQGIPGLSNVESQEMISSQWVYGFITRILFYLNIRRYFSELPDIALEVQQSHNVENIIKNAFMKALQVDWQAVFESDKYLDKIGIPKECYPAIKDLLNDLTQYNFSNLKEDVIGEIFEYLIPNNQKHKLGQYFTREDLVDFIIGFVVQTPKGSYCDPTCGSGTFLNRLYSRIKYLSNYSISHNKLLSNIWGFDIAKFPAELATINLFRQDISNYKNFPRIKVTDFFDVYPKQEFEFPPPKVINKSYQKIKVKLPEFEGMVGNFPFIRQEQIEKKIKGYKDKITKVIAKDWLDEYPEIFETKKKSTILRLSGQADIYTYLLIHTSKFVGKGGRLGFITSNSYLDVRYGYELKKFILKHYKIVAIVASWAEPWFEFASINTVFTILERCEKQEERNNHYAKFVKINKKLSDLIKFSDLEFEESERWGQINNLVSKIELCKIKTVKKDIDFFEDDDFSIRLVKQSFLHKEVSEQNEHAKWGKYIRAPEVYFELLQNSSKYLEPLGEMAEVRFGIKTGINDFFYLEPTGDKTSKNCINLRNSRGWIGDIEKIFLKSVIKSPKESEQITILTDKLKYKLFICNLSKEDLKKKGYRGALNYIKWGEQQRTTNGQKWSEVSSVKSRKHWWGLIDKEPFTILM